MSTIAYEFIMTDLSLMLIGITALVLLLTIALRSKKKLNAIRIGIAPGFLGLKILAAKREFAIDGHRLVKEGYRKVKILDGCTNCP